MAKGVKRMLLSVLALYQGLRFVGGERLFSAEPRSWRCSGVPISPAEEGGWGGTARRNPSRGDGLTSRPKPACRSDLG